MLVKAGSGLVTFGTSSSAGVPESFVNDTIVVPLNNIAAIEKALAENNDTERFAIYRGMEKIIIDEAPVVPLYYDEVLRFSQKNIEGLTANGLNLLNLKIIIKLYFFII